jgi:hypothetical protein
MASPHEKLAESLEVLRAPQERGVVSVRSADLTRTHRERLVKNGFLQEVMKGWYIPVHPDIECDRVWAPGKHRRVVEARSLLCFWAVRELGISMASLSRKLNLSIPAVSQSVIRGENIAKKNQYVLIENFIY